MFRVIALTILLLVLPEAFGENQERELWKPAAVQAELTSLYETLRDSHYDIYANRSRQAYDAFFSSMHAGFDKPMSRDEIQQELQRFVAYGNVAHARIDPPVAAWTAFREGGGRIIPVSFRVMDGGVYIADVMGDGDVSVGDRVLTIDGTPALEWLAKLRAHLSADSDYLAHTIMENMLPLLAWQEFGEQDAFNMEIARDEDSFSVTVPAIDPANVQTTNSDQPAGFELDWNAREARMVGDGIAYLRPGPFYDNRPYAEHPWDPSAFHAFVDAAFETFIAADARKLLIDLRNNSGGSNDFSDHLIAWFATEPFRFSDKFEIRVSEAAIASNQERLDVQEGGADTVSSQLAAAYAESVPGEEIDFPIALTAPREGQRFDGDVYLLVNRHSYSNAVSVAAIGQDYGFATVLGEPTADLANTYGGMEHFKLPLTGIKVGFPKARILRPSRELDADTVIPDVVLESPLVTKEDAMLKRAIDVINSREPT